MFDFFIFFSFIRSLNTVKLRFWKCIGCLWALFRINGPTNIKWAYYQILAQLPTKPLSIIQPNPPRVASNPLNLFEKKLKDAQYQEVKMSILILYALL